MSIANNILLKKRFTEAAINNLDELDFYQDLLEEGTTIEDVANAMGNDVAAVMQKFCEEHGLI